MKLNEREKLVLSRWIIVGVLIFLIWLFSACKPQMMYVPVESVKTEYKDRIQRDSVHVHDSILIRMKGDTVWMEKYRYLYRDKLVRDSVLIVDSVQVPYAVEVEKEVNRLNSLQSFQIWCGRILLLLVLGYIGFRYVRRLVKF